MASSKDFEKIWESYQEVVKTKGDGQVSVSRGMRGQVELLRAA